MYLIYSHKTCRNPNETVFLLHNRGNILLAIYLNSSFFLVQVCSHLSKGRVRMMAVKMSWR